MRILYSYITHYTYYYIIYIRIVTLKPAVLTMHLRATECVRLCVCVISDLFHLYLNTDTARDKTIDL